MAAGLTAGGFLAGLRRLAPAFLLVGGWLFVATAGYFLTYQLFFTSMPLEKVSYDISGAEERDFRYDGVKYFRGYELAPGDTLELRYLLPWIVRLGRPDLTVYLERALASDERAEQFGRASLRVEGVGFAGEPVVALEPDRLQRFTVPWDPPARRTNTATFTYLSLSASGGDDRLIVATNITGFNVWPWILAFLILGAVGIIHAYRLAGRATRQLWGDIAWISAILLVGYWIHSGAFTSNVFFSGHAKISGLLAHAVHLLNNGYLPEKLYRESGGTLLPLVVRVIESGDFIGTRGFRQFYPTSRYLIFAVTAYGLGILCLTLMRYYGRALAITFGFLVVTFFPFINDLYFPDADAYFIAIFPFVMALTLMLLFEERHRTRNLLLLAMLFAVMGSIKITPIFLALVIPACLLISERGRSWLQRGVGFGARVLILLLAFKAGEWTAESFQNPDRHIGVEGVPFQDTVVWHMVWAAYGVFDDHSAHWFTKIGSLRKERVSEVTGLENTGYVHQAQLATEEVYKPGVMNALKEDPGFFYSTAFLRLYNYGLKFYRYTFGGGGHWGPWLEDGGGRRTIISGEEVRELTREREAIRYGEAWKLSPLIVTAKLSQKEISWLADFILLSLAFIGMFVFKNPGLRAFLILLALAQIGFNSGVHGINRYFMFCSYALLLGLAAFLVRLVEQVIAPAHIEKPAEQRPAPLASVDGEIVAPRERVGI